MKLKNMKRVLNIYTILLLILTFVFYHLKLLDFVLIKLLILVMYMNIIIFSGIIGLKTNTVIIARGGDLEYNNTSVWGKIFNYILIFFGVVFIIIAIVIYIK